MSRTILAAGAVVLRTVDGQRQVAIIHRPRYDDWCLPKGKVERHEPVHQAAVREVAEETGLRVRLGVPLDPTSHPLTRDTTLVRWWTATVLGDDGRSPDAEIDDVRWLPADKARRRLTHRHERKVLDQALSFPETTPVLLVRHGKAISRKHWGKKKPDWLRPLARRGQAQAEWLATGLEPWAPTVVATSPSTRCSQTVEPYAQAHGLSLHGYQVLTEESGEVAPEAARAAVESLARSAVLTGEATVVCGHRPVLPAMCAALGMADHAFDTGELVAAHLDGRGRLVAWEAVRNKRPS